MDSLITSSASSSTDLNIEGSIISGDSEESSKESGYSTATLGEVSQADDIDSIEVQQDVKTSPKKSQPPNTAVEVHHKSSKKLYKAMAKQYGLTCKLSSSCPCLDCASRYFDCNFVPALDEEDNKEWTIGVTKDGGLGATTTIFVSEVMAGAVCTLL